MARRPNKVISAAPRRDCIRRGRLTAHHHLTGAGERVEYHHPDRLGTRLTTNNLNTSSYEQATLPYGTALDAESTGATNRRFTSYDRSSSTGLDYAVNRTYDSAQGRFTQVDPIEMEAVDLGDPQSLNLYTYCGNDPINHIDPEGLFFKKLFRWIKKHWKAILFVAVIVAIAIIATPGAAGFLKGVFVKAGLKFGLLSKAVIGDKLVYGLTGFGKGLLGSAAAGAARSAFQSQQDDSSLPDCSSGRFPCTVGEGEEIVFRTSVSRYELAAAVGTATAVALSALAKGGQALAECTAEQFGLDTVLGLNAIEKGQPTVTKRFTAKGTSEATSPASKAMRGLFGKARFPLGIRLPAPTFNNVPRSLVRLTPFVGKSLGRLIPFVGAAIVAYDVVKIGLCVNRKTRGQ